MARGREGVRHRSLASEAGVRSAAECELGYAIGVSLRTGCGLSRWVNALHVNFDSDPSLQNLITSAAVSFAS